MSVYVIPTSVQNPHYTQTVTLSGVQYVMTLRYNTRLQRWILDVANSVGELVVAGVSMLTMRNLLGQYTTLSVPPGILFCYNGTDAAAQPQLASFLTDTSFLYNDPST